MAKNLGARLFLMLLFAGLVPLGIFFAASTGIVPSEGKNYLLVIFLTCLVMVLISAYLLTGSMVRPIKKLEKSLDEIGAALENQAYLREKNAALTILAHTDDLTGLPNHRYLDHKLDELLSEAEKTGQPLSLVLCAIDHDVPGYGGGDEILKNCANRMKQMIPPLGAAIRYGGNKFALILPGYDRPQACALIKEIQLAMEKPVPLKNHRILFSTGTACYPAWALNKQELIQRAEEELDQTKKNHLPEIGKYFSGLLFLKDHPDHPLRELHSFAQFIMIMIHAKDQYTLFHTEQVAKYAAAMGEALSLPPNEIIYVQLGALFQDVGKLEVPESILNKKGPLTEDEWNSIKQHPLWGAQILSLFPDTGPVINLVKHHHERFDGTGYPDQLSGDSIPLGARIIAVADSFAAMTTPRPYRKERSISDSLIELRQHAGTQFDPEMVQVFMTVVHDLI
ncbi:HD domain-containing phosphohydrolase [Candidatus Formimonas warabiya]|uniref:Diguanylate cyclase n=1 Tax=Formimonas warabiya TaxID=1761012 RepID=A0A3G1KUB4_FORW1|nr:diguanylate cyclase [Candidatus Formimonas warabiya]ATW26007.1 hypothetical protein DCMF_15590 [Candidatus Formimonas warabiya]